MAVRNLAENDVQRLLDPGRLIDAIEAAFRDRYPRVTIPARTHFNLADGLFLAMPCYDPANNSLGMKLVGLTSKAGRAQGDVRATYLKLDPETGAPSCVMGATYLTELRTAATSAVATRHLARPDAKTLGIFGTGREARAHLHALLLVRDFERVLVCGSGPSRSREFVDEMVRSTEIKIEAATPEQCAAESDVICTCTNSSEPLFDGKLLQPGTHLNLVGAFRPNTREVDDLAVERSRVVVDTYDGALAEAGELIIPMASGRITRDHILANLHEMLAGKKTVRTSRDDITLFKSVGCALEDLVAAELCEAAQI